jgi:hypothetical protein
MAGREERHPWQTPLAQGNSVAFWEIPSLGNLNSDVRHVGYQARHGL